VETKAGKRVRNDKVAMLEDVLKKLNTLLSWSKYEDVEMINSEKAPKAPNNPQQRVKPFDRKPIVSAPAGSRISPNWNAKVGETIIGNLIRGEGGKFASKRNITDMMTMLEKANISPEMFQAMQSLLAGEKYTNELVLGQLREAGLVTADNIPTGKANDVIRAIKTAVPKNLNAVLNPSGGGGGRGGGAAKPSKEEIEQENIDKTGETLVQRGVISQEEFDAFKAFANGEDIDPAMEEKLKAMGLINANGALTSEGKDLLSALSSGEVRDALDAIANAKGEDTVTDSVSAIADQLVQNGALSKKEADAFVKFAQGENISNADADALVTKGLLAKVGDNYYLTGSNTLAGGRGLWTAMQAGKTREALDAVTKSAEEAAAQESGEGATGADGRPLPEQVRQNNIAVATNKILEQKLMTQDELGGLLNFTAGGKAPDEILAVLMEKGLLTKTARGNYVRSDAGKRFLQALEAGNGDSAILALQNKAFGNKVFKGEDGKTWFLTWTTNAFKDLEEEIFATKAIEDYIARFEDEEVKGTCQFWHVKGSDFATIRWQGGVGRFLVEMSTFDDTPVGNAFKSFFEAYPESHPVIAPNGWGCSHGYSYRSFDRKDGVYHWFDKKETTILPVDAAANIFTLAKFGLGEKKMDLSEKQKIALGVIGEETGVPNLVDMIVGDGKAYTELLESSGVQYKSLGENMKLFRLFGKKMDEEVLPLVAEDEEMKAEMMDMADAVADEPEAVMRRLMELTAQVQDEDLRTELEALIGLISPVIEEPEMEMEEVPAEEMAMVEPMASEMVTGEEAPAEDVPAEEVPAEEVPAEDVPAEDAPMEEETPPEEEVPEEEKEEDEEEEIAVTSIGMESTKDAEIQRIAKALNLKGLQGILEKQSEEITQFKEIALAMKELNETNLETIQELRSELDDLKSQASETEVVDDEIKAEEKKERFTPVWGGIPASRAVSTVVGQSEKALSKPKVPSTIASMSKKIIRG